MAFLSKNLNIARKVLVLGVLSVGYLCGMENPERPSKRQKCEDLPLAINNAVEAPVLTVDSVQSTQEPTDLESLVKSFNERCKKDQEERKILCKEQSSDDVKLREILHGYAKHALENPRWHASQRQILPYMCKGNTNFKDKLASILSIPLDISSNTVNFNATASAVSHDQKLLVLGNNNGDIEVYDIGDVYNKKLLSRWNCIQKREEMGSDFTAEGYEEEKYPFIAHMAINPDHTIVAASHNNGEILLWNVSDFNNPIFLTSIPRNDSNTNNIYNGDRYARLCVDSLDFSSNGNILLYGINETEVDEYNVCLWNIENINDINFIGMLDREGMGNFVLMNKAKNRIYHFFNEASGFDDSRREIYCLDLNASPAQISASMNYWHEHKNFLAGGYCDFEAVINRELKNSHIPECIEGFNIAAFAASEDDSLFAVLCSSECQETDACGGCPDLVFMFDATDIKNIRFVNFFSLGSLGLPNISNLPHFLPKMIISPNKQQLIIPLDHTISVLDISDLRNANLVNTFAVYPGSDNPIADLMDLFCTKNGNNELLCARYFTGLRCWNMTSVGKHIQDLTNGPLSLLHCTLLKDLFKRWDEFVQQREDQAFWNDRCNDFMSTLSEKDRAWLEEALNELEQKEIRWTPAYLAEEPIKKVFLSLPKAIQWQLLLSVLIW